MWNFETEGRGRRSIVLKISNDTDSYSIGDFVNCEEFVGGILAFRQGESSSSHEVQLLQFIPREADLLATSVIKWHGLDVLHNKIDKSNVQIRGGIDHHRHHKEKIEDLPTKPEIESAADLLALSKTVSQLFTRPITPRKRRSPTKPRPRGRPPIRNQEIQASSELSSPQVIAQAPLFSNDNRSSSALQHMNETSNDYNDDEGDDEDEDDESSADEESELVPARKRKQKASPKPKPESAKSTLTSQLAAATLDSPVKPASSVSFDLTNTNTNDSNIEHNIEPKREEAEQEEEQESEQEEDNRRVKTEGGLSNLPGIIKSLPLISENVPQANVIDRAVAELHPASDPVTHLCRDSQFDQLFIAIESAIAAQTGTCIYVSGTPGTGKTSIIREVIGQLDLRVRESELTPFTFLEINGMKLVHPNSAYEHLWEVLGRGQMAASNAMTALESAFTADEPTSERGVIVLLLDEMDQLVTKGQQLMYNFFNWPSLPHSRLVVIAVANTMDLPERILSNKISSRVGLTRIQFPGYTHTELKEIVMQRLEPDFISLIEDEAIEYATRKVAGVGGDARRVLDFVRQAIVVASEPESPDSEYGLPVKTSHVRDVIVASQLPPIATFIRTLGLATKVLLCAILARIRRTNNIEAPLHDILKQAAQFVKSASNSETLGSYLYPGKTARLAFFQPAVMELVESGILVQQAIKGEATPKVRLMVPVSAVRDQLEFDSDVKGMI